jgi:uncharacterized protein YfaS (alpha-2-macroglobulin family)
MNSRAQTILRPAFVLALRLALPSALLAFVLANVSGPAPSNEAAARPAAVPLFGKTEPATNPTHLVLQADDRTVFGWLSGTENFAGEFVHVSLAGGKEELVKVADDNTFSWPYQVKEPTSATFELRPCKSAVATGSITLRPRQADEPTVFFIVDRTAYRPAQTLNFAGFLRRPDSQGEFAPLAGRQVEVLLKSEKKNTTAAKLALTADEQGRIVGSYTFLEADALDGYRLSIPGFKGEARLTLGEFRKSKIKLKIDGQAGREQLKLKFQAVDFLDKPVAATQVSFTAQVIQRQPQTKKTGLKTEQFAYHVPVVSQFNLEDLPEDERLLFEAEGTLFPTTGTPGPTVAAQLSGQIELKDKEAGEYAIPLQPDWLKGNCSVLVQGVIVDANGREQRATQSIALDEKSRSVRLELAKRSFAVDEKIEVKARVVDEQGKPLAATTTLVAMRLTPARAAAVFAQEELLWDARNSMPSRAYLNRLDRLDHINRPNGKFYPQRWLPIQATESFQRNLATAVPFQGETATLQLKAAGAYKLIAITQLADGTQLQNEIGCVIRKTDDLAGLILHLDKEDWSAGDRLTGTIHSRFADARVLLTVRDANSIRLAKPLQLKGATLALDEALPAGLRYGCSVDVLYLGEYGESYVAARYVRVTPTDRMLTVTAKTKEVYGPGEKVNIDLQVNRQEPVDLVVSVYDQALLGIAADRSADIDSFYLADERIKHTMARELLRRQLGSLTLEQALERAKEHLKRSEENLPAAERAALHQLVAAVQVPNYLNSANLATLLRVAGVNVQPLNAHFHNYGYHWNYHLKDAKVLQRPLVEVVEQPINQWTVTCHLHNNVLYLAEHHPELRQLARNLGVQHLQQWNQNANLQNVLQERRLGKESMARGDSHRSVSGNASHSVEGQAFMSHLPAQGAPPVTLIDADADQSHIMVRRDFSDSAFWNATVRTDAQGKATAEFKLPDSLTNWQVVVTAVSRKMHVGQTKARFRTFKPIMVWPMIPRVFTEGDSVSLFASVHNCTDQPQAIRVKLKVENGAILTREETTILVPAKSNAPVYWTFKAGQAGFTQLLMSADCDAGSDASLKRLPVTPVGAEQMVTASGFCKDGVKFTVPPGVNLETAKFEINFAPSLAADMAETLNYLVEYPYGCVEQTMSRFLPAIKVAQVLKQFQVNHPGLNQKLPNCVAGGIKRLLELQQPDGGWGWHGGSQTHEMMTPYALFGLLQAEKAGYSIPNEDAIKRGLDRLKQFIDGMGEHQTADRIYCMYVYSHRRDIQADWWKFIAAQREKGKLSDYALALSLEMAVQHKQHGLADQLSGALHNRAQKANGQVTWRTAGFSRWGDDLYEVTAAAMKALVAYDKDDPLIDGVLGFFAATKRGNRWNSTKDTAMILYAMCDYLSRHNFTADGKQSLTFQVNGGAAQKIVFDDGLNKKATLTGKQLQAGENRISFKSQVSAAPVMYRLVFSYWQSGGDIAPMNKGIQVMRRFYLLDDKGGRRELKSGDSVPRGSYIESDVDAQHGRQQAMSYVLVESPKPCCAEFLPVDDPRYPQHSTQFALREERTGFVAFHHEQTPWHINDRCAMLAELAGEYVIAPARVELMYQTTTCGHSGTFRLKVVEDPGVKAAAAK